jgi:hypothetical protein
MPGFGFPFHILSSFFPSLRDYARDRAVGHGRGGWGFLGACCGLNSTHRYVPPGDGDRGQERPDETEETRRLLDMTEMAAQRAVNIIRGDTHEEKKKMHNDRRKNRYQETNFGEKEKEIETFDVVYPQL